MTMFSQSSKFSRENFAGDSSEAVRPAGEVPTVSNALCPKARHHSVLSLLNIITIVYQET